MCVEKKNVCYNKGLSGFTYRTEPEVEKKENWEKYRFKRKKTKKNIVEPENKQLTHSWKQIANKVLWSIWCLAFKWNLAPINFVSILQQTFALFVVVFFSYDFFEDCSKNSALEVVCVVSVYDIKHLDTKILSRLYSLIQR